MLDYSQYETLAVEARDDGVVVATLNRPDRLNAFDGVMRSEFRDFLRRARDDADARALVLTGAGRGFSSGADLGAEDKRDWPHHRSEPKYAYALDLLEMPKPTIAAVNGVAAGAGLSIALCCDIRICSEKARLIPIFLKRAIHPDGMITWTLPKLVGYGRALKWLYLAEDIPLEEAQATGLVQEVTAPDDLMATATELAARFAAGPTRHMALAKQAVLKGWNRDGWDGAALESWGQEIAQTSEDRKEGVAAFREKREPKFVGR